MEKAERQKAIFAAFRSRVPDTRSGWFHKPNQSARGASGADQAVWSA